MFGPKLISHTAYHYDDSAGEAWDQEIQTLNRHYDLEKKRNERLREATKEIERVELYLSSGFLKDGVLLVDSPGLNGVADHHREITERQVLRSHACIFMFSADHPGSKTDFQYLHQLKSKVSTVLFVLNKVDSIKRQEGLTVESIVDSLKNTYHEKFPDEDI